MSVSTLYRSTSVLLSKIESLKARAELLTGLKEVVSTKEYTNISTSQWYAINSQLNAVANKILLQLNSYADKFLVNAKNGKEQYKLL
jgi:hypothetical protein